jgi:hypothetical protein
MPRRASRSSTDAVVVPGMAPSSISAWRIHLDNLVGCTPESLAIYWVLSRRAAPPIRMNSGPGLSVLTLFGS